jgi:hypothetical protein
VIPILVFCPLAVVKNWDDLIKDFGIPSRGVFNYESLTGNVNSQPSVDILHRTNERNEGKKVKPIYTVTESFRAMMKEGTLLVLDEGHKFKNDSAVTKAVTALTTALIDSVLIDGTRSRCCILSATLADKEEQIENMFKVLGFVRNEKYIDVNKQTALVTYTGLQELLLICNRYDRAMTESIMARYTVTSKTLKKVVYELFVKVVAPRIMSKMEPPKIEGERDAKNGYYKMNDITSKLLDEAIEELSHAAGYRDDGTVDGETKVTIGAITTSLRNIESCKVNLFARLAKRDLDDVPNSKVICCLNYLANIDALRVTLAEYNPMILTGEIPIKQRNMIIKLFQTSPYHRLLICNPKVGGVGISLHDIVGNSPRFMYISPTYSIQDSHQAAGRIYRIGTKSKATIRFVYGNGKNKETGILNALAIKSKILEEVSGSSGVLFPGQYPNEIEGEMIQPK